jgi:hypothetical protein
MHINTNLESELDKALWKILKIIHGLDENALRAAASQLRDENVNIGMGNVEIVDGLTLKEALFLCAYLKKSSFKQSKDYRVYRCGNLYGLIIQKKCSKIIYPYLQHLQLKRIIAKIALNILKERRAAFGRHPGDIFEAIDLANKAVLARNTLSNKRCPICRRHGGIVFKEYAKRETYIIYARRTCCNHREKIVLKS